MSDLHQLAGNLTMLSGRLPSPAGRPDLRRPRLVKPALFRIRVDLDHAKPPIWRRLDLRSDLPLDVVHQVLQVAFDWTDSHLHRFSLGGGPFDGHSQLFLCPFDVEEGELGDSGGPTFDITTPAIDELNIIVAVTSFGLNLNCNASGSYRIDQPDDVTFLLDPAGSYN